MKHSSLARATGTFLLATLLLAVTSSGVLACPVCYGDTSGSKQGNAAAIGIFAMVVIMFFMLSAIGGFMWHLAYRAKNPLPDYSELLKEERDQPQPKLV